MSENAQTEKLIKEKARELFFQKGYLNATTQEIADAAAVNRALIHYYFESREQMLELLLDETVAEKKERIGSILSSSIPFREKISKFIDVVVDFGLQYPFLENFIISETARHPQKLKDYCAQNKSKSADLIRKDLEEEIKTGKLSPISAEHFMVNLAALCNYPILAKPILQAVHEMTDSTFQKFLKQRKQVIYQTIFQEEIPRTH